MKYDAEAATLLAYLYRFIDSAFEHHGKSGQMVVTRSQLREYSRSWLMLLMRDNSPEPMATLEHLLPPMGPETLVDAGCAETESEEA